METGNPDAKLNLAERYQMLVLFVQVSDNVKALEGFQSGYRSSSGSRSSKSSSGWHRHPVRAVGAAPGKERTGNCHWCKKPGHWMSNCPSWIEMNKKLGNCHRCGKPGHWSHDCPRTWKGGSAKSSTPKEQPRSGRSVSPFSRPKKVLTEIPDHSKGAIRTVGSDRLSSGSRKGSRRGSGKGGGDRKGRSPSPRPKGQKGSGKGKSKGKARVAGVARVPMGEWPGYRSD